MKFHFCLLVLMVAPARAQQRLPSTFAVSPTVSLRIWLPSGTVRLESWDRDSVRVTGSIANNSVYFAGGRGAAAKLGVSTTLPEDTTLARGDLVVTVPRGAHVWVKMTDGELSASGGSGELEVVTVAGSITIANRSGVVSVDAIDATVTLTKVNGAIRVTGGGGRVLLTDVGGTLTASTISGALLLTGDALGDAYLRTIGGTLTLRGRVSPKSVLELETHNGDIELQFDPVALPKLTLSTRAGSIRNPFKGSAGISGSVIARSFKGDLNLRQLDGIERRKPFPPP